MGIIEMENDLFIHHPRHSQNVLVLNWRSNSQTTCLIASIVFKDQAKIFAGRNIKEIAIDFDLDILILGIDKLLKAEIARCCVPIAISFVLPFSLQVILTQI